MGNSQSHFISQLRPLLKICFPSLTSRQSGVLAAHTLALILRTGLSISVAALDGRLVKTIVDHNLRRFVLYLAAWIAIALPATFLNSTIRFLESTLALGVRSALTRHLTRTYTATSPTTASTSAPPPYYALVHLDSRIANADQCLTSDIGNFADALAHLWSQLSKPWLDVVIITARLVLMARSEVGGGAAKPAALAAAVIFGTAGVLRSLSPSFGRLVSQRAELEGRLRHAHARLSSAAEEIAFYGGHEIEAGHLWDRYSAVVAQLDKYLRARALYSIVESFFMKYVWTATGLTMIALPAFYQPGGLARSASDNTQLFMTSRSLLVTAADAVERILASLKEVSALAGYTSRVSALASVMDDVSRGVYVKTTAAANRGFDASARGVVSLGTCFAAHAVPLVTPAGDVLVNELSFTVEPGVHMLVCGPNGCGKSSLVRVLAQLWPLYGGSLTTPPLDDVMIFPQSVYLSVGTLRDQVLYPESAASAAARGVTDADLVAILKTVHLTHVLAREADGWDTVRVWQDVLSGGERQRLALARLFFHKPKFAILDECTSAVSADVEGAIYGAAKDLGTTLITISHRATLVKYHDTALVFDGAGAATFTPLGRDTELTLGEEAANLRAALADVPAKRARLAHLCAALGEDSLVLEPVTARERSTPV